MLNFVQRGINLNKMKMKRVTCVHMSSGCVHMSLLLSRVIHESQSPSHESPHHYHRTLTHSWHSSLTTIESAISDWYMIAQLLLPCTSLVAQVVSVGGRERRSTDALMQSTPRSCVCFYSARLQELVYVRLLARAVARPAAKDPSGRIGSNKKRRKLCRMATGTYSIVFGKYDT